MAEPFSDVIYLIINSCEPRHPKGASGGHEVKTLKSFGLKPS